MDRLALGKCGEIVKDIKAFSNHPFKLYEGERLTDMVESIKEHGTGSGACKKIDTAHQKE